MADTTPTASGEGTTPLYFPVSRRKLIVLSIFSLCIYETYWFYKNWVLVKRRTRRDINPLGRALLPLFYCDDLFEDVAHSARVRMMPVTIRPGLLTLAYIGLLLAGRLPNPFWLVATLSFLPLLPVLRLMEEINLRVAPHAERNDRFSDENILVIAVGSLAIVWFVIAPFVLE